MKVDTAAMIIEARAPLYIAVPPTGYMISIKSVPELRVKVVLKLERLGVKMGVEFD